MISQGVSPLILRKWKSVSITKFLEPLLLNSADFSENNKKKTIFQQWIYL
jgi:hypothetical protein